jgi:hypothetical protein
MIIERHRQLAGKRRLDPLGHAQFDHPAFGLLQQARMHGDFAAGQGPGQINTAEKPVMIDRKRHLAPGQGRLDPGSEQGQPGAAGRAVAGTKYRTAEGFRIDRQTGGGQDCMFEGAGLRWRRRV